MLKLKRFQRKIIISNSSARRCGQHLWRGQPYAWSTMDIIDGFDSEKYYLGKLCKRGHAWNGTGKSLRYKSQRSCFYCRKEDLVEWRRLNPDKVKCDNQKRSQAKAEWHKNDYRNDPEKYKKRGQDWRDKNPEAVLAIAKRYRQNHPEKIKLARALYYAASRDRILARKKELRPKYKERSQATFKAYRLKNREKLAASAKAWNEKNQERRRFLRRRWRENNPEKVAEQHNRRRLAKKQNHKFPYSSLDLKQRWEQLDCSCAYCQKLLVWGEIGTYQIDHFITIRHGGPDTLNNVVYSCTSCNRSKNSNDPKEWYMKQPFFSLKRWKQILLVLGKSDSQYNQLPLF